MELNGHQLIEVLSTGDDVNKNEFDWKVDVEKIETEADEVHEEAQLYSTNIEDLPDELIETIFLRLSPYNDLDAVKQVSHRWKSIATGVVQLMRHQFKLGVRDGTMRCIQKSAIYENNRVVGSWMPERFGQTGCYHDKSLYIIGGTSHMPTTFNDMWRFDLSTRIWSRVIAKGSWPPPKAFATAVSYGENLYVYGGWSHPSTSPLMPPWSVFDELHRYNVTTNSWTLVVSSHTPPGAAGHSASVHGEEMYIFGGRTHSQTTQSFPVSNLVWSFDFTTEDWSPVLTDPKEPHPGPRYGQTQVALDRSHLLIIGGSGAPTQTYNDVWMLSISTDWDNCRRKYGTWTKVNVLGSDLIKATDVHYGGCKIGDTVVFMTRSSTISPYLGFLHFDSHVLPVQLNGILFEPSRAEFQGRPFNASDPRFDMYCPPMAVYALDISKVLTDNTVTWFKEPVQNRQMRPYERHLYSAIAGRSELVIFGGYFRDPSGRRCRVSNDVFILKPVPKSY